jgi:hypothetical protein
LKKPETNCVFSAMLCDLRVPSSSISARPDRRGLLLVTTLSFAVDTTMASSVVDESCISDDEDTTTLLG